MPAEISVLKLNILDIFGDKNANKRHPTSSKKTRNRNANRNKKNTKKDT